MKETPAASPRQREDALFNWLSSYNYDFALATIPIQLFLLGFFVTRRNLPVHSSRSFLLVIFANIVMTTSDIIACELNEVWESYPLWLMYAINIVYFVTFITRTWRLFDYTANECHGYEAMGRHSFQLAFIPCLVAFLLIVSTPWTAAIFTFSPGVGYENCALYPIIYYCTYFYIAMSLMCLVVCRKRVTQRLAISIVGYNSVLIAGILLRKLFYQTLVTSYFSTLAILFIFLAAQNPDLYRDRKTHLFNRDAFERITADLLYDAEPFHLIAASVQNYEIAKATYGYEQLCTSLSLVGAWLCESFPGYYVFYFGSGTFLLLHKGDFEERSAQVLRELDQRFAHSWKAAGTDVSLSLAAMALPYASLPNTVYDIRELSRLAFDRAYFENRRGNVVLGEDLLQELHRREQVKAALGRALRERRIEVYLQPIYSAAEQRVVRAEALARLNDPELGFVPPAEFVRVAERTGDILELGRQIFERVCEVAATHELERLGIDRINVNLSPAQCMDEQLATGFAAIAGRHDVSMSLIDFEITESSTEDYLTIKHQLLRLQREGATFSLDDFGTGQSNLTRLLALPIAIVKLDMQMVWAHFKGETSLLPDLVRMFHNARMDIVVEGVETEQMKLALEDMGCDYEQGYYFSQPLPPEEFVAYLRAHRQELQEVAPA